MLAGLVTRPTATQNFPFHAQWWPRPSPVHIPPTHGGMDRMSGPEWPGNTRQRWSPILVLTGLDVAQLCWC